MISFIKKKAAQRSIKQTLMFFNIVILIFVVSIIIISNIESVSSLNAYTDSFYKYDQLNQFYENVHSLSQCVENYFYSFIDSDYETYQSMLKKTRANIDSLINTSENQVFSWRFSLLRNMIDHYDEQVTKLKNNKADKKTEGYRANYDYLVRLGGNIQSTSSQYHNIITQEMNTKRETLIRQRNQQNVIILIIVGVMGAIAIMFSILAMRLITRPIRLIVDNINQVKAGHFDLQQIKNPGEEMAVLFSAFGEMATSVKDNMEQIEENAYLEHLLLEKENENLKISNLLTETELKMLQSQMNPHFLFNTLSTISRLAYIENAPRTCELIETTADLLRYSLEKGNKTSRLFEEIESIKNYIKIQNIRLGHRVEFSVHIEDDIPNMAMPGMIIQPLVENSVIHGVGNMLTGAKVSVSIYSKNDNVYIVVLDNGKGMSSDRLKEITDFDQYKADDGSEIGLYNVHRRLSILLGIPEPLSVVSDELGGTMVMVTIPRREEDCV